jgi:hypothetical protein
MPQSENIMSQATIPMPLWNERTALTFDNTKPRELPRFFEDVEQLFDCANVTNKSEKKQYIVWYVDYSTEQMWKTFLEFKSAEASYNQFKKAILVHYPDAADDFIYSLHDMDILIGERYRKGIMTSVDLSDYHLQFVTITSWLIKKNQLGILEQQWAYVWAFQLQLLSSIMNQLQLKYQDHHLNTPYKIEHIYEAAWFILQSSPTIGFQAPNVANTSSAEPTPEPGIKKEDLGSLFVEFSKTIIEAIKSSKAPNRSSTGNCAVECIMCGGLHYGRECSMVNEYIKARKCKRNFEGKVVLPSGAFVKRDISGWFLIQRIDEWHRQHLNQLSATTMIHTISWHILNPHTMTSKAPSSTTSSGYHLTPAEQIASLQAQIYNLCNRPITSTGPQTRAQKAREPTVDIEDEDETPITWNKYRSRVEEVVEETLAHTQEALEHPFKKAKDAVYIPPAEKNVGIEDNMSPTITKKHEPAYRTLPPIHNPAIVINVLKRSMEAPITIMQKELLSLSPEVCSQVRDSIMTHQIPKEIVMVHSGFEEQEKEEEETMLRFCRLSKMWQARLWSVFIFTSYKFHRTFYYMFHHLFYMSFRFQPTSIPLFHLMTSILLFTWLLTYDSLTCFTYI